MVIQLDSFNIISYLIKQHTYQNDNHCGDNPVKLSATEQCCANGIERLKSYHESYHAEYESWMSNL